MTARDVLPLQFWRVATFPKENVIIMQVLHMFLLLCEISPFQLKTESLAQQVFLCETPWAFSAPMFDNEEHAQPAALHHFKS